jgi:hypothetical protein
MSARDDLIEIVTSSPESSGGDATWATDLVDAYRTEVLAKAVGRLRAIPVDCTALTGPVWYGAGWNSAITCLEEIADYQTPDDEAYPGELQRLRALALGLRVAALRKEDLAEVRRLLVVHAEHEMEVREKAAAETVPVAPDFFQPGHTYTHGAYRFSCEYLAIHPTSGRRSAWGWFGKNGAWRHNSFSERQFQAREWTDITEADAR